MIKLNPPFRADQVGSLLRTPEVKETVFAGSKDY
jgi:hypothetical protein